jgi:peroxiredoxin
MLAHAPDRHVRYLRGRQIPVSSASAEHVAGGDNSLPDRRTGRVPDNASLLHANRGGRMRIGQMMPALTLPSTTGGPLAVDHAPGGSRSLVLYVHPRIGRPDRPPLSPDWASIPGAAGCTAESCSFRDLATDIRQADAEIIGVSTQEAADQAEAAERLGLRFPLVSDAGLALTRALALPTFEVAGTTLLRRCTLIVEQRRIARVFDPVTDPVRHPQQVHDWLARERRS